MAEELSKWKRNLVNLWQTAEHRRQKYWLLRSLGCNPSWARAMRDWRLSKIERRFNLSPIVPSTTETQFNISGLLDE